MGAREQDDREGRLGPWLGLVAELCGARRAHWMGLDDSALPTCPRRAAQERWLDRSRVAGLRPGEEREVRDAAGSPRLRALGIERVRLGASSRPDAAGRGPAGVLWLVDPMGERRPGLVVRLADQALELVAADAEREAMTLDARRGRRAAGLLHDLRNELSLASLELMRVAPGPEAERLAESLERSRALACSGLGSDAASAKGVSPVDVAALVNAEARHAGLSSHRARIRLEREGVTVRAEVEPDLCTDRDATLLRRVLRNLITNAVEASEPGGQVTVRVARAAGEPGVVEWTVEDHGRGMDAAAVQRAFRDAGTTGGTGYGTTSLFDCLRELRAELEVTTAPGSGTIARVRLADGGVRAVAFTAAARG